MRWAKINRPWILGGGVAKDNTESGLQEAVSSESEKYTWEDGSPLFLAAAIEARQRGLQSARLYPNTGAMGTQRHYIFTVAREDKRLKSRNLEGNCPPAKPPA